MVYDATRSKLNASLWAPNFGLPTVDSLLRGINETAWMGDLDIGEMFLNFCLHPTLQPYCGIDLRPYFAEEVSGKETLWERWVRCMMGMKNSPYVCIKGLLLALEWIKGDHWDVRNPFHWDTIQLNLPGDPEYNPRRPRLEKVAKATGKLAAVIVSYVDDMRTAGFSSEECWHIMHAVASRASYLGIQVAARKTRPPAKQPGPWSGAMVVADEHGVAVRAMQDKWDKIKEQVLHISQVVDSGQHLDLKMLESVRGSLVYLQRTYPAITPYVKGFHLTIDSWRHDRNSEGWRITGKQPPAEPSTPPAFAQPVPRLRDDLQALTALFGLPVPPLRYVRSTLIREARYGFADASGSGFGCSFSEGRDISYSHGVWTETDGLHSSNYRELSNLVDSLEAGVQNGQLRFSEVFVFTDNSTSESVFWKGHSPSRKLNDLALRLRLLEMRGDIRIHMIHVPGSRMIAQGTDGLSRGDLTEGVMAGDSMLSHVPLRFSALDRQPQLVHWLRSWVPSPNITVLSVQDWFTTGHGIGGWEVHGGLRQPIELPTQWFVWSPAPALADVMLDELEEARHKRKQHNHIVVIPRLMTYAWRKRLRKICDLVFELPPGARAHWPLPEHEPLVVGLTLRFSASSPWQVKRATDVLALERTLREVWRDPDRDERIVLHEFCLSPERMDGLLSGVVR